MEVHTRESVTEEWGFQEWEAYEREGYIRESILKSGRRLVYNESHKVEFINLESV